MDATRALLDELMGRDRNVPLSQRSTKKVDFRDPDVCKYALVACCPHELFVNTRSALGPCGSTIHEDHLDWAEMKQEYEALDPHEKDRLGYERELVRYLDQLVRDMDRKIVKNKERAAAESAPRLLKPEEQGRLDEMQARMREALESAAKLGEAGQVDESLEAANMAESIKRQHDSLKKSLTAPERSMEVCDICGVFINSTDNDQRRLDHLLGKQYLGWKKIREVFADLTKGGRRPEPSARGGPDDELRRSGSGRDERERERMDERYPRSSGRERERERSPGRGRDYDRDHRSSRSDYADRREYDRREYDRRSDHRSDYRGRSDYGGSRRDRDYR